MSSVHPEGHRVVSLSSVICQECRMPGTLKTVTIPDKDPVRICSSCIARRIVEQPIEASPTETLAWVIPFLLGLVTGIVLFWLWGGGR